MVTDMATVGRTMPRVPLWCALSTVSPIVLITVAATAVKAVMVANGAVAAAAIMEAGAAAVVVNKW